jgi:hypothetical protein
MRNALNLGLAEFEAVWLAELHGKSAAAARTLGSKR